MKKLLFVLILSSVGHIIWAQSQETLPGDSIPWEYRKQSFIYNTSNALNDPIMSRTALYNLLAENPGNAALYDSLALSYLQSNQPVSAALAAEMALGLNPNDMFAVGIAANQFDRLGIKDKAITYYEKLYLDDNNINTLYKISFLQLELQRYAESVTSVDIIASNPQSDTLMLRFPAADGGAQEVSLKAAALRVKAMVEESRGNIEEAKAQYLAVLELQPGFEIVQQQLRELTKPEGGE